MTCNATCQTSAQVVASSELPLVPMLLRGKDLNCENVISGVCHLNHTDNSSFALDDSLLKRCPKDKFLLRVPLLTFLYLNLTISFPPPLALVWCFYCRCKRCFIQNNLGIFQVRHVELQFLWRWGRKRQERLASTCVLCSNDSQVEKNLR